MRVGDDGTDRQFLLRGEMWNGMGVGGEIVHDRKRGQMQALLQVLDGERPRLVGQRYAVAKDGAGDGERAGEVCALGLRQRLEVIRHRVVQRRIMLVLDLLELAVLAALRDREPRIGAADIADQSQSVHNMLHAAGCHVSQKRASAHGHNAEAVGRFHVEFTA